MNFCGRIILLLMFLATTIFSQNVKLPTSNNMLKAKVSSKVLTNVFLNTYKLSSSEFSIVYPTQKDTFIVGEVINPIITLPADIIIAPSMPSIVDWYTEYSIDDGTTWVPTDKLDVFSIGIVFTIPAEITDQCILKVNIEYYNGPSTTVTKSAITEPFTIIEPEGDWELFTGTVAATCKKVNEITEDRNNNIWAATGELNTSALTEYRGGLMKYNGADWITYNTTNSELPSNYISSVCCDSSGNIWIGTWPVIDASTSKETGGLVKFDGTNWTVYDLDNSDLPALWISQVEVDSNGEIWVASSNEAPYSSTSHVFHISKFNGTDQWVDTDNSTVSELGYVTDIEFDDSGNMWLANGVFEYIYVSVVSNLGQGIIKYNGSSWTVLKTGNSDLAGDIVFDMEFDSYGDLYVSSYDEGAKIGKIQKFDGSQWSDVYTAKSVFLNNLTMSLEILGEIEFDHNQNLFFGSLYMSTASSGGINFSSRLSYFSTTDSIFYTSVNSDMPDGTVQSISIDHNGHRWIGTTEMDYSSSFEYQDSHIAMLQLDGDTNNPGPNPTPADGDVVLSIGSETTFNGAMVTVPVNLQLGNDATLDPYSISGKLKYDNSKLSFNSSSTGSSSVLNSSNWSFTGYSVTPGEIDFILSGSSSISSSGLLFQINFTVSDPNSGSTEVYGNSSDWKLNYSNPIITSINSGTIGYTSPTGESTLRGDASLDFKVDAEDITVITNYIYLGTILSAQALINADADLDGSVTMNDATAIAMFLGLGDWSSGSSFLPYTASTVSIPTAEYESDNLILLPVTIKNAENVRSFDLFVEYDPEEIVFQNFSTDLDEKDGFYLSAAEVSPGKIQFSFSSSKLINQDFTPGTIAIKSVEDISSSTIKTKYKVNDGDFLDGSEITLGITDVSGDKNSIAIKYDLMQNYPNPFNPTTMIQYSIPKSGFVSLKIFNLLGEEVKTLVSKEQASGVYNVQWNGENNIGQKITSGIYIYCIEVGNFIASRKLVLLK